MLNKKGNKFYLIVICVLLLSITAVIAVWPFSKPQAVANASKGFTIECNTFSLNPSVYLGKTGNQVCKSLGYATCVSLNDATLINGGENRAESAGPCTGDSVVINDIKVVERHQEGTYTSSVSCCRLK
ncbi:MAG TPA: hypothetical protein VJG30_04155 [Candidatus Nanoarchaeia archaeon]|nr:hypothetical protein [Candidatus Nanoarchaeia archaeon]